MPTKRSKGKEATKAAGGRKDAQTSLLVALSHGLRQRIFWAMEGREMSPAQLARELDEPIGNVSYHVKRMAELNVIELVRTAPVRGALAHFYRPAVQIETNAEHWAQLPTSARRKLRDRDLQAIWEDVVDASDDNRLDDPQTLLSSTSLELDEAGYKEVAEILGDTLERVQEIQAQARARLAKASDSAADGRQTEMVMMHFDRARAQASERRPSAEKKAAKQSKKPPAKPRAAIKKSKRAG